MSQKFVVFTLIYMLCSESTSVWCRKKLCVELHSIFADEHVHNVYNFFEGGQKKGKKGA